MTVSVAIAGASGYTGGELLRLLSRHEGVSVKRVTSERYQGQALQKVFPHLQSLDTLTCQSLESLVDVDDVDVVFCALPHLTSMSHIPPLLERGVRVVDLSADFRLNSAQTYQAWYGATHLAPELLSGAVYGLPELNREAIIKADLVANPGCYPTSILLALMPLIESNAIDLGSILIDSKSGASGTGRAASQATLYTEIEGGFKAYKVSGHRHTPEIEQELSKWAKTEVRVRFVPHLLPQSRGILSTCHVRPLRSHSNEGWRQILADFYKEESFVQVLESGEWPATNHVRGSNYCHLAIQEDERTGWLTVVSVIDNLTKGAAGQAVQNMNLMFSLPEHQGLGQLPLFP